MAHVTQVETVPDAARARPVVLDTGREPVFGFLHEPVGRPRTGTAALIVGPWGWDEVVTYRSRRDWAERLARAGHLALRIDLPGAGDSAGSDTDPDRPAAWSDAVRAAVDWLGARADVTRVAVIGMGLGGISAARAVHEGAPVDDLVLWALPTTGRAWVREMRAFAGLQGTRFSLDGETEPQLLPDGWLEVGGFVLTADTIAELGRLDPREWSYPGLRRALLLDRDGLPIDEKLRAHLAGQGIDVTVQPGSGWSAMTYDIEKHRPPTDVFATVEGFLASAATAPTREPAAAPEPTVAGPATLHVAGGGARETPITFNTAEAPRFGILVEPEGGARSDLCAVFLNAGAVRRIGPNRMWVTAARRWAARGVPSLRLDIEAIGDADGDPAPFADVNAFYRAGLERGIVDAIDRLERRGLGPRFVVIGLCSGAYWGFQVAAVDPRIVGAVLLNPRALVWDPHIFTRLAARDARKVLTRGSWGRLLRGRIGPRRLAQVAGAVGVRLLDGARRALVRRLPVGAGRTAETVESLYSRLDRRGTSVVLAFSDEEPLRGHFEDTGLPGRIERWPNASWVRLPGRDHTVRPIVAQTAAQDLVDRTIARLLERAPVPAAEPTASQRPARPPSPAS
jgi:hypothetical protein